jgi:hypothetical protein
VAVLSCPTLQLTVQSDAPGIQVSTANDWSLHCKTADVCKSKSKNNAYNQQKPWSGICLEPQQIVPDSGISIGIGETSKYHKHIVEYNVEQTVDATTTMDDTTNAILLMRLLLRLLLVLTRKAILLRTLTKCGRPKTSRIGTVMPRTITKPIVPPR